MAKINTREHIRGSLFAPAAVLVIALLTTLAGCKRSTQLTAEAVIQKAYVKTSEVGSFRYRETTTMIDGSRTGQGITEGERVLPDREHSKGESQVLGIDSSHEQFWIGNTGYARLGQDGEWQVTQVRSALDLTGLPFGPLSYLDFLIEPIRLEDAKIGSLRCLRYQGGVDTDSFLPPVTAVPDPKAPGYSLNEQQLEDLKAYLERMRQSKWVLNVWISEPDFLVRRLELEATYSEDSDQPWFSEQRVVEFYDFNKPIDIHPPI
jgi:hypothetical protein